MASVSGKRMSANIRIRPLGDHEEAPMELLLLADPSEEIVATYLRRGRCFVAVLGELTADANAGADVTTGAGVGADVAAGSGAAAAGRDKVVGVYVLIETRPETVELVNVAVAEALHAQGIGKLLVQHAVATAKELGYKTIELGTGNSGVVQLALYQKCGFRIVGVDLDFFVRHYPEPIYENGIPCRDMIRLVQHLTE